jgi:hypothetical protein
MAGTKRKGTRPDANRKPLSKSLLLPMLAQSARDMSLAHHLALAACRGDSGNQRQINELVRSVYMAYFLQRMGFGKAPFECYEHAEAAFENALAMATKSTPVDHRRAGRARDRTLAGAARPAIVRSTDAPGSRGRKTTTPIPDRNRRVAVGSPEPGLTSRLSSDECVHFSAMPHTKRVSSRARLLLNARPKPGALMRYGDRIAEVLDNARGERVMIRSLHADGVERRSAVKWKNLRLLDDQLF